MGIMQHSQNGCIMWLSTMMAEVALVTYVTIKTKKTPKKDTAENGQTTFAPERPVQLDYVLIFTRTINSY